MFANATCATAKFAKAESANLNCSADVEVVIARFAKARLAEANLAKAKLAEST